MRKLLLTLIIFAATVGSLAWYQSAKADIWGSTLQLLYRFDNNDISGTTLSNKTTTANNGTIVGSAPTVSGVFSQGMSFDGSTQRVSLAGNSGLNYNDASTFTMNAWVKTTDAVNPLSIISTWDFTIAGGFDFFINAANVSFIMASLDGSTARQMHTAATVSDGKWHMVTVTYTGSGTIAGYSIYVDGVKGTNVTDANTGSPSVTNSVGYIGALKNAGAFIWSMKGSIDDIRIYNTVKTQNDIIQMYLQRSNHFMI